MTLFALLAIAIPVPAAIWFFYIRYKDRLKPEPLPLLVRTFALGMVSAFAAVGAYWALDRAGIPISEAGLAGPILAALPTALGIGLVEEGTKFLPVLFFAYRRPEFDEEFDGFVYAGVAALGFAAVENWFLLARMNRDTLFFARAFVSPFTHALIAAPWGLGLAMSKLRGQRWAVPIGLAASCVCHGLFDLCLFQLPPLRFGSALIILALWAWFLWKSEHQVDARSTG
jgi:RsiW-degrading membrane proteinase PrsW (M82 family)